MFMDKMDENYAATAKCC